MITKLFSTNNYVFIYPCLKIKDLESYIIKEKTNYNMCLKEKEKLENKLKLTLKENK